VHIFLGVRSGENGSRASEAVSHLQAGSLIHLSILLQDAVIKDARKAGEDTGLLASLQDECALAKCRLALVKQQIDPHLVRHPFISSPISSLLIQSFTWT
jgi:hypothetical protein